MKTTSPAQPFNRSESVLLSFLSFSDSKVRVRLTLAGVPSSLELQPKVLAVGTDPSTLLVDGRHGPFRPQHDPNLAHVLAHPLPDRTAIEMLPGRDPLFIGGSTRKGLVEAVRQSLLLGKRHGERKGVAVTELRHGRVPGRWGSPAGVEAVLCCRLGEALFDPHALLLNEPRELVLVEGDCLFCDILARDGSEAFRPPTCSDRRGGLRRPSRTRDAEGLQLR